MLIPAIITEIFNPMTELITATGIPIKEAKAEMEVHPLIVEITISGQCRSKLYKFFYNFYSLILFDLFL